jgi:hypothetical protein
MCVCVCACVWVGVNKSIKAAVTDISESRRTRSTAGKRDDWDWCEHFAISSLDSEAALCQVVIVIVMSRSRSIKQAQAQFP